MERGRIGYHGRVSSLVSRQMEEARIAARRARIERERQEMPIYWTRLEDITEELFGSVIDIYGSVYEAQDGELKRPDFSEFSERIARERYADWHLLNAPRAPLEARTRIGGEGTFYVRFRIMPGGSTRMSDSPNAKRDQFQKKVDELFLEKGIAVRLEDTF